MSLPTPIQTPRDADAYVAYSVLGLIARLRASADPRVSTAALRMEMRLRLVLHSGKALITALSEPGNMDAPALGGLPGEGTAPGHGAGSGAEPAPGKACAPRLRPRMAPGSGPGHAAPQRERNAAAKGKAHAGGGKGKG